MASVSSLLPRIFHWVFLVLVLVFVVAAWVVGFVMVVNPHMPAGSHLGPAEFHLAGQQATVVLRSTGTDSDFLGTAFGGNISVAVEKAGGLLEVFKHYGLPVIFLDMIFLASFVRIAAPPVPQCRARREFHPRHHPAGPGRGRIADPVFLRPVFWGRLVPPRGVHLSGAARCDHGIRHAGPFPRAASRDIPSEQMASRSAVRCSFRVCWCWRCRKCSGRDWRSRTRMR